MMDSPFKKNILKDNVALITGGGSGICFGIAQILGLHGCKLALLGRRLNVLKEACSKLKELNIESIPIQCDVRNYETCIKAVEIIESHYQRLDYVINGAAGNFLCSVEDMSANAFKSVVEIDLIGTFNVSKACLPLLKKSPNALIINISATLPYWPTKYQAHASAAKAGIDVLTRNLALEWAEYGIRVNGIAPGPIKDTEGMKRLSGKKDIDEHYKKQNLPRAGTVHEIAYVVLFLTTKNAEFVNGETITVDGGHRLYGRELVSKDMYKMIQSFRRKSKM